MPVVPESSHKIVVGSDLKLIEQQARPASPSSRTAGGAKQPAETKQQETQELSLIQVRSSTAMAVWRCLGATGI